MVGQLQESTLPPPIEAGSECFDRVLFLDTSAMRDIYYSLKETTCAISTWGAPCSRITKREESLLLMRRAWHNQTCGRVGGEWCVGRREWCSFWWNEKKRCSGISSYGWSLEEQEDASVRMFQPPTVSLMMHLSFCTVLLFSPAFILDICAQIRPFSG